MHSKTIRKYLVLIYFSGDNIKDTGYKVLPWGYINLEGALREARSQQPSMVIYNNDSIKKDIYGFVDLTNIRVVETFGPELPKQEPKTTNFFSHNKSVNWSYVKNKSIKCGICNKILPTYIDLKRHKSKDHSY